jgi:hypothetical protein
MQSGAAAGIAGGIVDKLYRIKRDISIRSRIRRRDAASTIVEGAHRADVLYVQSSIKSSTFNVQLPILL